MRKYLLIFAMLAIVLTACRIETNVNLDIEEDGSAVVLVEVGMDDEFREAMGDFEATEEDFINEILSFGDTSLVQRSEGDMSYFGAAQEIDDLSQGLPLDAAEDMFTAFNYSFDEDGAKLTASIQSADTAGLGDFGDFGGIGEGLIGDIFSANVIVHMPGNVTSHNADEVRDGALVWQIPLTGTLDIQAESSFGDSSSNWIWFAIAAVVIVGVVSATIAVLVTRKESEKAVAAAIAAHEEDNRQQTTDDGPEAEAEAGEEPADDGPRTTDNGSEAAEVDEAPADDGQRTTDNGPEAAEGAEAPADDADPVKVQDGVDAVEGESDSTDASDTDET